MMLTKIILFFLFYGHKKHLPMALPKLQTIFLEENKHVGSFELNSN